MTNEDIMREIRQTAEAYGEWIDMAEDPQALLAGLLAKKVLELKEKVEYLEKRLEYVTRA